MLGAGVSLLAGAAVYGPARIEARSLEWLLGEPFNGRFKLSRLHEMMRRLLGRLAKAGRCC